MTVFPAQKNSSRLKFVSASTEAHKPKKIKTAEQIQVVSFIRAVCADYEESFKEYFQVAIYQR